MKPTRVSFLGEVGLALVIISSVSLIAFTRFTDPVSYATQFGLAQFHVDSILLVGILLLTIGSGTYIFARMRGASSSYDLPFLAVLVVGMVFSVTISRILWNPLVFLPTLTEPFHLGAVRYILANGQVSGDVYYHQWPGSFIGLAALSLILGATSDQQLVSATLLLSVVCDVAIVTSIYIFSTFFLHSHLKALVSSMLYLITGFFFIFSRSFFDPQFWAWTIFLVLYSCIILSPKISSLSHTIVFTLLGATIVTGHAITTVFLGFMMIALVLMGYLMRVKDLTANFGGKLLLYIVLFVAWTTLGTRVVIVESENILSLSLGIPFASYVFQTGLGVKGSESVAVPFLVTVLRYYRIIITMIPIGLSAIFGAGLLIRAKKQRARIYSAAAFLALVLFAGFQVTLLSQALSFWERVFFLAFPFLAWMSADIISKPRFRRWVAIAPLLGILVASSFSAAYLPIAFSYTNPELNAAHFVTQSTNMTATFGVQQVFWEMFTYENPSWGSNALPLRLDNAYYISPPEFSFNRTQLENYIQQHPTFYTSQIVARSSTEVELYYSSLGLSYPEFWGKVDLSLDSAAYNRVYDSSWIQIYSDQGM